MSETSPQVRQTSMVQVAAYLAEVGEEGKFKKLELVKAVPNVSQADRRMRDLRSMGWEIDNYKVNPSLKPDEYLIRKVGVRVDLGEKAPITRKTISGPKRRRIFERDGHACQVCFTAGGSEYADVPGRIATLTIGHIVPVKRGGSNEDGNLRTECQRCNDESRDLTDNPPDKDEVLMRVTNVGGVKDKRELFAWMQAGHREQSAKDRAFVDWARLPVAQRLEVLAALAAQVIKDEG